jgi:hypothetical protein
MFVVRIILPFLYCLLVGTALGLISKRKFIDSLAPAFFIQILLVLFSGLITNRLTIGIALGVIIAIVAIAIVAFREKTFSSAIELFIDEDKHIDLGVCLFVVVYGFIFLCNLGKGFSMWDEFSHWGWFVREAYGTDMFYCISPKGFAHKDYLPGVALFETVWCRLSLKYSESNAFRGMQMLQAAMMMPVVCRISEGVEKSFTKLSRKILALVLNVLIIFGIPLFSEHPFYHTLYQDLILGVFVFYCIWITISEEFSLYSLFLFGLSLSNLILCKLTAVAFLPILFLFYAVYHSIFSDKAVSRFKIWLGAIVATVISVIPWRLYNSFLSKAGLTNANGQSYDSIGINKVLDVITHNGNIPYQNEVENAYIVALVKKGVIGQLSYLWIILGLTLLLLLFMLVVENTEHKRKIGLVTLWVFLAGVYYAIVMYFMYMLMFSEYEALGLASYKRYMFTYILVILLVTATAFILYGSSRFRFVTYLAILLLVENIVVFCGANQLLPDIFPDHEGYEGHVEYLNNTVPAGSRVLFIDALADMEVVVRMQFYCDEISIAGGIFGAEQYDGDVWSEDLTTDEFVSRCASYDYIYFYSYDDGFVDKYSAAFESSDVIAPGRLYQVENANGKIRTSPVG